MSCVCGGVSAAMGSDQGSEGCRSPRCWRDPHAICTSPLCLYIRMYRCVPQEGEQDEAVGVVCVAMRVRGCLHTCVYLAAVDAQPCCWLDWGDGPPHRLLDPAQFPDTCLLLPVC